MAVISKKIEDLINFRIVEEETSSRIYLGMSKWLLYNGYNGASKLWKKYSDEEQAHSTKAFSYLEDLDILPKVPSLDAPETEFDSLPQICKLSYEHELKITKSCSELAKAAANEQDYMTLEFAQWYLTEQKEEIMKTTNWLNRIEMLGGENITKDGLFLLDQEMAEYAE